MHCLGFNQYFKEHFIVSRLYFSLTSCATTTLPERGWSSEAMTG
jgi:hypothetical protein